MRVTRALLMMALIGPAAGCATSIVVKPPAAELKSEREVQALEEIRRVGRNGDWLVIRGYHVTDNLVSALTDTPWSHAAVLDLDNSRVVEAEAPGVHFSSLSDFVAKSHRLLLVRPVWSNGKTAPEALERARAFVGKSYNFLGLAGIDVPERFYCSELAVAAYRPYIPAGQWIPRPVAPSQLHYWGRILYDSGAL